jgi:hypothetical protein
MREDGIDEHDETPDESPLDNLRYFRAPQTMPPLRRVTNAERALVADLALAMATERGGRRD